MGLYNANSVHDYLSFIDLPVQSLNCLHVEIQLGTVLSL